MLANPLGYQQAAVRKALDQANLRTRILLADAVGLGKTLEIGMILAELIRRGRGERILIVTPRHVLESIKERIGRLRELGIGPSSPARVVIFAERVRTLKWLQGHLRSDLRLGPEQAVILRGGLTDTEHRYGQHQSPQITTLLLNPDTETFSGDLRVLSRA